MDNVQLVGMLGDDIIVMNPQKKMTKDEALAHAAWLVAMADDSRGHERFSEMLKQVSEA